MANAAVGLSPRSCSSDPAVRRAASNPASSIRVCLLTGGDDPPYAIGMASALAGQGINVDFIGSDKLDTPELHRIPLVRFLNLRGNQNEDAPLRGKVVRILAYYLRLTKYVVRSKPRIFHILWNNKFEHFDRTLLMLYTVFLGNGLSLRRTTSTLASGTVATVGLTGFLWASNIAFVTKFWCTPLQ